MQTHKYSPPVTEAQLQQQLVVWNSTNASYPLNKCIHQLFEDQAALTPDDPALIFPTTFNRSILQEKLTYRALNNRANQLARYLQSLGVGPEIPVAICMEPSLERTIGLLAILKAGGAYIPLDPAYPRERLAFILADSQAPILLTQRSLSGATMPGPKTTVLPFDSDEAAIRQFSPKNLPNPVTGDHPAYVIYTSGSTGNPKGVVGLHRGAVNRFYWMWEAYPFETGEICCQKTSLSFVDSVWEIFGPLLQGVPTVVLPDTIAKDPHRLMQALAYHQISRIVLVPTLLRLMLALQYQLPNLKYCSTSGEALPAELPLQFFTTMPHAALLNLYGASEVAADVTSYEIHQSESRQSVPIGRPIANMQTYILDVKLQPVPTGSVGELHVGGVGLARGYINRPGLTAERFVPNPFSQEPGARLYKTGDLARYLPDGNIEFQGRIDQQIKIRGFRVEPGEIETALNEHQAVNETTVIARDDLADDRRLVAYVVPNLNYQNTAERISEWQVEQTAGWQAIWQALYDEAYRQPPISEDPTFNITGWQSSYTGEPIPAEQMQEWVTDTVKIIRALEPQAVLEVGVGTGLILFKIAPYCSSYVGTDFSKTALDYVAKYLPKPSQSCLELLHRPANNFDGFAAASFDSVILNSVIQYFPSVDYLLEVLDGLIPLVKAGGAIFIGDVRNLPLLEAFHASVQLSQAPDSLSIAELRQRAHRFFIRDEELVVDPAFFIALKRRFPTIAAVQLELKHGQFHNELSQFRYNVILRIGPDPTELLPKPGWLDWQDDALTLSSIRRTLAETKPDILGISRIPNARVKTAVQTLRLLDQATSSQTAGDLRAALTKTSSPDSVDPESFRTLADALSYDIIIGWSEGGETGDYDLIFSRPELANKDHIANLMPISFLANQRRPWRLYANNPLEAKLHGKLIPLLRSHLEEKLPDYMIPSAFALLDALPLLPNGKIDRRALPAPDAARRHVASIYVAPRTATEATLAKIWAGLLGLKRVGIHDNFFELGGHSLLATQLISRLRDAFQIELPLLQLLEISTIANLTERIETMRWAAESKRNALLSAPAQPEREEGEI